MLLEHVLLVVSWTLVEVLAIRVEREKFAYFSCSTIVSIARRHNIDGTL